MDPNNLLRVAMLERHRTEKKELRARMLAMKKAAKSGNKQKQKDANAECDKLEKDLEERHRREVAEADAAANKPADETPPQVPANLAPPAEGAAAMSGASEDEEEAAGSSKFYKNFKISGKNAKKQARKKEQEEKMKAAQAADKEAANRLDNEKRIERAAVKELLALDRLKMIDIPADGDCMYNAIVHQLQEEFKETSARKLRKICAKYMREHKDEFVPFISESDVADGVDSAAGWETYLQGVERCAEAGGVWGGELELKAVSLHYQKVIVIYRETGKYQIGDEFLDPENRALRIVYLQKAFHLGEHYNSTCIY